MVIDAQREYRQQRQQQGGQTQQHGVPGKVGLAAPQAAPRRPERTATATGEQRGNAQRNARHHDQRQQHARQGGLEGMGITPGFVLAKMDAAEFQARKIAHGAHATIGFAQFDGLLGIGAGGQRCRIGFLVSRAQWCGDGIERREHFNGVNRRLAGIGIFQPGPVMQGIGKADQHKGQQHRRRRHARPTAPQSPPCGL